MIVFIKIGKDVRIIKVDSNSLIFIRSRRGHDGNE